MTTSNCVIKSTFLGREDHGILTCFLYLEGDGYSQGFGGYDLRFGVHYQEFLVDLPEILGVRSWEELPGTLCRVERDGDKITRVGHIVKDSWFEAP